MEPRLQLDPEQPGQVVRALEALLAEALLAEGRVPVDPWWRRGLDTALAPFHVDRDRIL